jgi:hypothetical protein
MNIGRNGWYRLVFVDIDQVLDYFRFIRCSLCRQHPHLW